MSTPVSTSAQGPLDRNEIARLIAADIPDGSYVNLGIGQPTLVADYLRPGSGIVLHTENGMLGMGPAGDRGRRSTTDLTNAGKVPGDRDCRERRTSTTPTRSR